MSNLDTENKPGEHLVNSPTNDSKLQIFDDLSLMKKAGKEDVSRLSEPSKPLKPLLRQLSELEPMASTDSLSKRYMRIFSVVALYW